MDIYNLPSLILCCRQRLAQLFDKPVILWARCSSPRNFSANTFHFRASSHFIYFAGLPRKCCYLLGIWADDAIYGRSYSGDALWHGEMPSRAEIAQLIGADAALPMAELQLEDAATVAVQDATKSLQSQLLKRPIALQGLIWS